ncbi:MAG: hypothetical protein AABX88_00700 [Nanoarchaeota archaeon]
MMNKFDYGDKSFKEKIVDRLRHPSIIYSDVRNLFKNTPAEILVAGGIGLILGTGIMYHAEKAKEKMIPTPFSEIGQLERDAKYDNTLLTPINHFLPSASDTYSKVAEAWNKSFLYTFYGDHSKQFAKELDIKMNLEKKIYTYQLSDLLKILPERAKNVKEELKDFKDGSNRLKKTSGNFKNSWDRHFWENSHQQCHTSTDSEGHTTISCITICDSYNYKWDYHPKFGEVASKSLDELLQKYLDMEYKNKIKLPSQTNAEGEYAAETSFLKKIKQAKDPKATLTEKDYMWSATLWYTGSTFRNNLPLISSGWREITKMSDDWRTAKTKAKSQTATTPCYHVSDPEEYTIAMNAMEKTGEISKSIDEIFEGVNYAEINSPILERKIKKYIAIELDNEQGDSKKEKEDIMNISKNIYTLNIKKGADVSPFKAINVILGGIVGAFGLGLIGAGYNWADDKYGLLERFEKIVGIRKK